MSRAIVLRPSAKINLTLRVGPLRADGFHEVRTLMQSIAINDVVTVTSRTGPFGLLVRAPGVPTDRTNLVWRAAEKLWKGAGRAGDPRDAHVKLDKHIPTEAGLGGGSADAAAALVGLNQVWNLKLPRAKELCRRLVEEGLNHVPWVTVHGMKVNHTQRVVLQVLESRRSLRSSRRSWSTTGRSATTWSGCRARRSGR